METKYANEVLKPKLIILNGIVLRFLREKFSGKEGFEDFYSEVENKLNNLIYKFNSKDENAHKAAYSHNDNSISFSEELLNNSFKEIIGVYLHELSHCISGRIGRGQKFEEGVANLFSDIMVDYINEHKSEYLELNIDGTINYKEITYSEAGSIVRNIAIISGSPMDFVYYYHTRNINYDKLYGMISDKIDKKTFNRIIKNNVIESRLSDEEDLIELLLKDIDIKEIPSFIINNNNLIQKEIIKKLGEQGIYSIEETMRMYPNLPKSFFDWNRSFFTETGKLKYIASSSFNSDDFENNLANLCKSYIGDINLERAALNSDRNFNSMNYILTYMRYSNIFESNLEFQNIVSFLIGIELIVNKVSIDEAEQYAEKIILQFLRPASEPYYYQFLKVQIKKVYDTLRNSDLSLIIGKFNNMLGSNIKNALILENDKKDYEAGLINDDIIKKHILLMFKDNDDLSLNGPHKIIIDYLSTIFKKIGKILTPEEIDDKVNEYQKFVDELNLTMPIDVKTIAIRYMKYDSDLFEFSRELSERKYTIHINRIYDDLFAKAADESYNELSLEQIKTLIGILSNENFIYNNNQLLYNDPMRAHYFHDNPFLQEVKVNIMSRVIELYKNGDRSTIEYISNSNDFFELIHSKDISFNFSSNEEAKKLIFELNDFETEKLNIGKSANHDEDSYYNFNERNYFGENYKQIPLVQRMQMFNDAPYLRYRLLQSHCPPQYLGKNNFSDDHAIDMYISYKDDIPELAKLWKDYALKYIETIMSIPAPNMQYDSYSLYGMASFINRLRNYPPEIIHLFFGDKFDDYLSHMINVLATTYDCIDDKSDYYLQRVKEVIDSGEYDAPSSSSSKK